MTGKKKFVRKGVCLPLLFITVILTCIGLLMIFSSSYATILIKSGSVWSSIRLQLITAVTGFFLIFIVTKMDYRFFSLQGVIKAGYIIAIVLLVAVFFFDPVRDSHRWIRAGSATFQSSEFAKIIGIIYASAYVAKHKWWYRNPKQWFQLLAPVAVIAALILAEPDLSATLCFLGSIVVIMFVSGMPWGFLVAAMGCLGALIPVMIAIKGYQSRRFSAWLHAWDDPKDVGYQVIQSLYAIGDGGLFGVGLGNSKQKITHLPMSDTDYIFSIICEEFGFIGAIAVIGLYVGFAFFGIKIAMEAPDKFGSYSATGITTAVVLQTIINMAVATNIIPSTGITLPFISKGASSLLCMLFATGILLSISSNREKHTERGR